MAGNNDRIPTETARRWWWVGVGVMVAAAALRLVALSDFEETLFARWPQVDAYTYWDQAQQMFKGKDPFKGGYYQPPGYPWLLAIFFRALGGASLHAVRVFNQLFGFFSNLAILWLGTRLGRALGRPWVGPLAAALFLLYPTTLLFELDILTPAVTTALFLAAITWSWSPGLPSPRRALVSGLWLGLVAMIHPTYLLVVPALLLSLLLWRGEIPPPEEPAVGVNTTAREIRPLPAGEGGRRRPGGPPHRAVQGPPLPPLLPPLPPPGARSRPTPRDRLDPRSGPGDRPPGGFPCPNTTLRNGVTGGNTTRLPILD